jgi:hypothetical protein
MIVINTPPPAVGAAATDDDWVRVDLTDTEDPWTKSDPDGTGSSIGARSITVDTTNNNKYVDGCVHYRELKTPEGNDFDFTDRPVTFDGYVTLPNTGWQDDLGNTGGLDQPPEGSRTYVLLGVCTDPENLPTPRDVLGCGLEWQTAVNRLYRSICRNTSNSAPNGVIDTNKTGLKLINSTDVSNDHKASNRIQFQFTITKCEMLSGGTLDPAEGPRAQYLIWSDRYDNGDKRTENSYSASQRFGRTRTTKLYVWVAVGRGSSGAGASAQIDFDCYYKATMLDGGNSPNGKTGLPS